MLADTTTVFTSLVYTPHALLVVWYTSSSGMIWGGIYHGRWYLGVVDDGLALRMRARVFTKGEGPHIHTPDIWYPLHTLLGGVHLLVDT